MMQAMVIEQFGDAVVFAQQKIKIPTVSPGHVLVRVKATSINPLDIKIRNNSLGHICPPFPAILHGDVAGVVTAVADDVDNFKVGDEVYGCAGGVGLLQGALAEYMAVDANLIALKPKNISMQEAAALPLVSLTAWLGLKTKAQLKENQSVFIYGATGGVGHIAIQLAKVIGARVATTCSSPEKARIAKSLGADLVIDYKKDSIEEKVALFTNNQGFDVVFDTVGGDMLDLAFKSAKLEGHILTIMIDKDYDLTSFFTKGLTLSAIMQPIPLITGENRKEYSAILTEITKLVEKGQIKPLIDANHFAFTDVRKAHEYVEANKSIGKTVLFNNF